MTESVYTREGLLGIIEALPLAVALIDGNRKVALANRKTYVFANKNEETLIGHIGGEAFGCAHHDDVPEGCGFGPACLRCRLRESVFQTMSQKEVLRGVETVMTFKGIGERHLKISTSPLNMGGKEMVLLSIEDITDIKLNEKVRLEKERLSTVLKTAGGICHELNQPMMVIKGFSDLLMEDLPGDSLQRENLIEIKTQIERMADITRRLMSITRFKTKPYLNGEIIDIQAASDHTPGPAKGER